MNFDSASAEILRQYGSKQHSDWLLVFGQIVNSPETVLALMLQSHMRGVRQAALRIRQGDERDHDWSKVQAFAVEIRKRPETVVSRIDGDGPKPPFGGPMDTVKLLREEV